MAQYPAAPASFTAKQNGDTIEAAHINDLQDEVIVITDGLLNGLAHHLIPLVTATYDLGSNARKWRGGFFTGSLQVGGAVTAGGGITAGGTVTAPNFSGNGAGLVGVPGVTTLDGLTDVDTPAPANGQFLRWNSGTLKWEAQTFSVPGGGAVNMDDLLDVTLTAPAEGQALIFRSGQWVNETPSAFPAGVMMPFPGTVPPAGFLFADGAAVSRTTYAVLFALLGTTFGGGDGSTTFNVPNMQRRMPMGKAASGVGSNLGENLGAWDHTHATPAHTHGAGSLAVASHNHSQGTLAVEAHAHGAGGLVVASHSHDASGLTVASHTHGATGLGVANHFHQLGTGGTTNSGAHRHSLAGGTTDTSPTHSHSVTGTANTDAGGSFLSVITTNTGQGGAHSHNLSGNTATDGDHSHGLAGTTDYAAPDVVGVTAAAAPALSGALGAAAPGVTGSTAVAAPALTGNTGATAPGLSGVTANDGGGTSGAGNPPVLVLNFIIKT